MHEVCHPTHPRSRVCSLCVLELLLLWRGLKSHISNNSSLLRHHRKTQPESFCAGKHLLTERWRQKGLHLRRLTSGNSAREGADGGGGGHTSQLLCSCSTSRRHTGQSPRPHPRHPSPYFPPPWSTVTHQQEGPGTGFQGDRDAQPSLPQTGSAGWASCIHAECPPHLSYPDSSPSGTHLHTGTRAQLHSGEQRGPARRPPAHGHSPEEPFKIDPQDGTEGQLHVPRQGGLG